MAQKALEIIVERLIIFHQKESAQLILIIIFFKILSELGLLGILFYVFGIFFIIFKLINLNHAKNKSFSISSFQLVSIGLLALLFPFVPKEIFLIIGYL